MATSTTDSDTLPASSDPTNGPTASTASPPNAFDRLDSLYASPAPFTSIFLPCGDLAETPPIDLFEAERATLHEAGAPDAALDAIAARLTLPVPDDMGGWAVYAAGDGSTAADFASEGPVRPFMHVGALPIAAPLLEWDQWRVPHATVSLSEAGSEIVIFLPGRPPWIVPAGADAVDMAAHCRRLAMDHDLRLVVVGGPAVSTRDLVDRLFGMLPPNARIVGLDPDETSDAATFANSVVRHVADVVARDTVQALEDFRFLDAGGRAVQGAHDCFEALSHGRGERLLIHDDPESPATASFGATPTQVSADGEMFPNKARLADVAIWAAVTQGMSVRIVPTTGSNGPTDNIGLTLRQSRP